MKKIHFINYAKLFRRSMKVAFLLALIFSYSCEQNEMESIVTGKVTLNISNGLFTGVDKAENLMGKVYFCDFPGNPPVEVPVKFFVRFLDPGTSNVLHEFEGVTDLMISFEIPLAVYDVEVSSYQGETVPRKSKDMILYQKEFGIDFTLQDEVSLSVFPVQTLVLIAKKNMQPGNKPRFKTEFDAIVSELFEINEDYYGAYIAPENDGGFPEFFNGEIEMTDSAGKSKKVNEPWQRGKLVKYMNCPDAETGIQVASGSFSEFIDTTIN